MLSRELRHLFGAYAALPFLVILSTHHSCSATKNTSNYCAPSSCGNILHDFLLEGVQPFHPITPEEAVKLMCLEKKRPPFNIKGRSYPPDLKE